MKAVHRFEYLLSGLLVPIPGEYASHYILRGIVLFFVAITQRIVYLN